MAQKVRFRKRVRKLLWIFSANSGVSGIGAMRVRRLRGTSEVHDVGQRRVLELCDGRSVHSVIKAMYNEELKQGSEVTDIGMWKNLFDQHIVQTIKELAEQGFVYLETDVETPLNDGSTV